MNPALIWSFARQELIDRYAGSALGFGWAFIQPLVMMFIFVVIFGQIMGARLPGNSSGWAYSIYLIAGMLPWLAFSNTVLRCSTVFVDKKGVLSKVGLPLPSFPFFILLAESITFLISALLFALLLLVLGVMPRSHLLILPWLFLTQQVLALALGLIFAVLNVFLRDVREFVQVLIQIWFWMTPIVWVPAAVPPPVMSFLSWVNPVLPIVQIYQSMFVGDVAIHYFQLSVITAVSYALLAAAYIFIKHLEKDVRDFL